MFCEILKNSKRLLKMISKEFFRISKVFMRFLEFNGISKHLKDFWGCERFLENSRFIVQVFFMPPTHFNEFKIFYNISEKFLGFL